MKTAFVFPGQGSQQVKMLADFSGYPVIQQTVEEASTALGYDVWQLIQENEAKLNQTEFTQPALLTTSVALWRLWLSQGGQKPDYLAGHSLGEYSALVCADALSLSDGVKLVAKRGALMQQAVKPGEGAMAAIIGLEDQKVIEACRASVQNESVSVANFNSPGQVVIAGHKAAVDRAIDACKQAGAKRAITLAVSVPSHCALMQPTVSDLAGFMASLSWSAPTIPIIHNVDVTIHQDIASIQKVLTHQLTQSVRWVETVQQLQQLGCNRVVECGPGKVLTGLNKRIVEGVMFYTLGELASFQSTLQEYAHV
jgi:[acyl-carrier-protein] S-malonyltransferase